MYNNVSNSETALKPFRFWCQTVLPLVYDDSLSYYELLNKVVLYLNEMVEKIKVIDPFMGEIAKEMQALKDYVDNWIESAHLDEEIDAYIDEKFASQTFADQLTAIVNATVGPQITQLNTNLTNLTTRVGADETKLTNAIKGDWNSRSVLFVGDSYLTGWNGTTSVKTYSDYMNDYLHFANYYKASLSGCGFGTSVGNYYLTPITSFVANHSSTELNAITDVFIMGGYNDKDSSVEDIIGGDYGINATVTYVRNHFPNASITIGFLGRALYTPVAMTFAKMQRTVKAYRKGAIQAGCKYLEGSELCLHDYTLFSADHIHPTSEGYNQLGDYLTMLLLDKDFDYIYTDASYGGLHVDFTNSAFNAMPTMLYQGITRNAVTLDSYGGQHTFGTPIASWQATYSNEIYIGNFKTASSANYFMPKYSVYMPVAVAIQHSNGVSNVEGVLVFNTSGEVRIAINALQSGSWNFETFTDVTRIIVGKATVNIPIEYC